MFRYKLSCIQKGCMKAGVCMGRGWSRSCLQKPINQPTSLWWRYGFMEELSQHREVGRPVCRVVFLFGDKSIGAADHCDVLGWLHALAGVKRLVQWVLDQDSAQWYLIPDINMAFWFCVTELLNLSRPQFPYKKMCLTVCCMVSWLLRLYVPCNEFWLSLYLCAVPSTVGAKIYLA